MGRKVIFCCRRGNALVTTNPSQSWNTHTYTLTHTAQCWQNSVSFIICQITHGQSVLIPILHISAPDKSKDPHFSHRNLIFLTSRLIEASAPAALFQKCPERRSRAESHTHVWGELGNSPWKSPQAPCLMSSVILCARKHEQKALSTILLSDST